MTRRSSPPAAGSRVLITLLAGSLIAAPALPAMAGGSGDQDLTPAALATSAFEELGAPQSR